MRGWILLFVMVDLVDDVAYRVIAPVTRIIQSRSLALQHQLKEGWPLHMPLWIVVTRSHQSTREVWQLILLFDGEARAAIVVEMHSEKDSSL